MKNFYFVLLFLFSAFSVSAADVAFAVNMNGYDSTFTQVYVSGSLNGWAGDANALADEDADGIWTGVIPLDNGDYEFKFTLDNWAVQEQFEAGAACTKTSGDNNEFTNRAITVAGDTQICFTWNACTDCEGNDPGASTSNVTFSVDMNGYEGEFTQVYVSGSFNGWAGDANLLYDTDGDGVWAGIIPLDNSSHEYKFTLDNWAVQEEFAGGEDCTLTTGDFTNRLIEVTGDTTACFVWNSCTTAECSDPTVPVPIANVTFSVDMNPYEADFTQVFVSGSLNGWAGDANVLADEDGDGIWSGVIPLEYGAYEYKFTLDNWAAQEEFAGGEDCTLTTGDFTNRLIEVGSDTEVCFLWNTCTVCPTEVDSFNVTFTVDMSLEDSVNAEGMFIAGTFNGWTDQAMTDNGDNTWSYTGRFGQGDMLAYKFKNGTGGWEANEVRSCTVEGSLGDRGHTVGGADEALPTVCFNSCFSCFTDVTLRVDPASLDSVAPEGMFIAGSFNGWTDGPMTQDTNGIWSATLNVAVGSTIQYKFKNGPDGWEDGIAGSCTNSDGNRIGVIPGGGGIANVVCFNSCVGCNEIVLTLTVDMNQEEVASEGVFVAGSFNGWTDTKLTDNGDGTWSGSGPVDKNSVVEYKFKNGPDGWEGDFSGDCGTGNRSVTVAEADVTVPEVCFNSCMSCTQPMVTFTVDMSEVEVAAEGVFLAGSFNEFTDMPMTDNGDGTWSATVQVAPRMAYEYKFKNGPDGWEEVAAGCAFGFLANREVKVSNIDVALPTVCFSGCVGCGLVGVTFTVDMSQENVDAAGVRVAGSFTEWTDVLLTDVGNGIWSATIGVMPSDTIEFKYKNGPDGWEGNIEGECAAENGNRTLIVGDMDAAVAQTCFNSCDICMDEPDPDPIGMTTLNIENSCMNDDGTITIRFDLQYNCETAPGDLSGMSEIGFHSGANNWSSVVEWDAEGAVTAVNNGSDVFELTIDPVAYYGLGSIDELENIMLVFNQGPTVPDEPWASEGKTNGDGGLGACADIMLVASELRNCADIGGSDKLSSPALLAAGSCVGEDGTVTINFNLADNCMEAPGSLAGMSEIGFHSGANDWSSVVEWNGEGAVTAKNNGEDQFSVTLDPAAYYGIALADLTNIFFVLNQGPAFPDDAWASEGKAQGDGECVDFNVTISELPTCVMEPTEPAAQDLPLTFEDDNVEYMLFGFGELNAARIDNPDGDGKVLSLEKTNGSQPWAGVAMPVATVIDLSSNTEIHLDIWSPRAGIPVLLKIEDTNSAPDANGNPSIIAEVTINTTGANAWETLTFDMSTYPDFAATNAYNQVVVFPDMNSAGLGETFYVDNIRTDLTISTIDLVTANQFRVAPNPFNDQTLVTWENATNATYQVSLLNVTGQVVKAYQNIQGESLVIAREELIGGMYFLNFRDEKGNMGTMKLLIK